MKGIRKTPLRFNKLTESQVGKIRYHFDRFGVIDGPFETESFTNLYLYPYEEIDTETISAAITSLNLCYGLAAK